jgi:hypothetical protein
MISRFSEASTLADGFIVSVACTLAGLPLFLIAPPSGGKTVCIRATEKWMDSHNMKYRQVSRIAIKGLKDLSLWINRNQNVTLTNDDFSLIGSSDYMTEKMAEIVASLSYDHRYVDYGNDIVVSCSSLAFISGLQPLWLQYVMRYRVWDTHLREKFIRFYMMPHKQSRDLDDVTAINSLSSAITVSDGYEARMNRDLLESLISQLGYTRGYIYYQKLHEALTRIVERDYFHTVCRFLANRISIEDMIVVREISDKGYEISVGWRAYTMLYWCMRIGTPSKSDLCIRLGVTPRSVERLAEDAMSRGWIAASRNSTTVRYVVNPSIAKMFSWRYVEHEE